jgi:hypothetical protein
VGVGVIVGVVVGVGVAVLVGVTVEVVGVSVGVGVDVGVAVDVAVAVAPPAMATEPPSVVPGTSCPSVLPNEAAGSCEKLTATSVALGGLPTFSVT